MTKRIEKMNIELAENYADELKTLAGYRLTNYGKYCLGQ